MKIAFVANASWNLYNFRLNLIQGFLAKGYEVICIAPEDVFSEELKKLPITFIPIHMHAKGNNPFADFKLTLQLHQIYKSHKPDLILQYTIKPNIYGTLAARLCRIPTVNTVTGLGTVFLHNNVTSKIAQRLYAISFRFAEKVVFQNEDDRELFVAKKLVAEGKTTVIRGSGVNIDLFKPSDNNENQRSPFRFLMVSRLLYDKGIREYARASKLLYLSYGPDIQCIIIGAIDSDRELGIYHGDIKDWADEHHLIYKPFSTELLVDYQYATVVVLPSYREGLPKSLLEAASCAKPLIATNVAGCKDIVINGWNGLLCEVKNETDLFDKMKKIYSLSSTELNEMANNSRELAAKTFSDKIIFNEYFCLAERLFKNKSN